VQEDVLGRAKKAKEQAAREAMEGQGIIPKPTTVETTSVTQGVSQTPSPSTANAVKTDSNPATKGPVLGVSQTPSPSTANAVKTDSNPATKGPVLGVSSDD
jgi:hypothetical protein